MDFFRFYLFKAWHDTSEAHQWRAQSEWLPLQRKKPNEKVLKGNNTKCACMRVCALLMRARVRAHACMHIFMHACAGECEGWGSYKMHTDFAVGADIFGGEERVQNCLFCALHVQTKQQHIREIRKIKINKDSMILCACAIAVSSITAWIREFTWSTRTRGHGAERDHVIAATHKTLYTCFFEVCMRKCISMKVHYL